MTISELRTFIQGQAMKLYEAHVSKERKERLDKHIASKKADKPKKDKCGYCGSAKGTVSGPETGGWEACADCGGV